jgi:hypothetical protein
MKELLILFFITLTLSLSAQFHPMLDAQGVLKDADGFPVEDGPQEMTFRLYPDAVSNQALWSETVTLEVSGGAYQHYLGSLTPIDQRIFENTVYLGVSVEGVELTPRSTFTVTPYAIALTGCTGAVGDVKMSVLSPEEFTAENGACWELMSGQALPAESKLAGLTNWQSLPDARGRFLRSFDARGSNGNDSERGNTPIPGSFQNDGFTAHKHALSWPSRLAPPFAGGNSPILSIMRGVYGCSTCWPDAITFLPMESGDPPNLNILAHTHDIPQEGGTETRPKNINLYIYMRTR